MTENKKLAYFSEKELYESQWNLLCNPIYILQIPIFLNIADFISFHFWTFFLLYGLNDLIRDQSWISFSTCNSKYISCLLLQYHAI